ncbi:hypothetical protein HKBW3S44_01456, partial [Candidatus Hakubella thermalkaliphila]
HSEQFRYIYERGREMSEVDRSEVER